MKYQARLLDLAVVNHYKMLAENSLLALIILT